MAQDAGSQEPGEEHEERRQGMRRRATDRALRQADESLRGVLSRAGEPLPPPRGARGARVRKQLRQVAAALPRAAKLRRLEPPTLPSPGLRKLEDGRARLERAVARRAELIRSLRPAQDGAGMKALPAGGNALQVRASHVATRYGAHALVLAVVLIVLVGNAFPAFQAQAGSDAEGVADRLEYSQIDSWLDVQAPHDPADPTSGYLSNPVVLHTEVSERAEIYTVRDGDTLEALAQRFGLRPATIMAANGIVDPTSSLVPGSNLVVLPVDGTYHVAAAGETLEAVAQLYQVQPEAIAGFKTNGLEPPFQLKPGQALVVPGGQALPRERIITHRVLPGETLEQLAQIFGLDVETILYANPAIQDIGELAPGMELSILPLPGMAYTVREGDTLQQIAAAYGTDPQLLVDYAPNGLSSDADLKPEQVIILPGGRFQPVVVQEPEPPVVVEAPAPVAEAPPAEVAEQPAQPQPEEPAEPPREEAAARPEPVARGSDPPPAVKEPAKKPVEKPAAKAEPAKPAAKKEPAKAAATAKGASRVGSGKFIWPVSGVITTYFGKRHNGIDIANKSGTPLRAADSGEVIHAGWRTDGLGYAVLINHHNGYVTVYGHMVKQPPVRVGQLVAKGQVIGYMGSTGRSTGPHIHFIIRSPDRVYMNPLRFLGK